MMHLFEEVRRRRRKKREVQSGYPLLFTAAINTADLTRVRVYEYVRIENYIYIYIRLLYINSSLLHSCIFYFIIILFFFILVAS